jgi:hypothetical protein
MKECRGGEDGTIIIEEEISGVIPEICALDEELEDEADFDEKGSFEFVVIVSLLEDEASECIEVGTWIEEDEIDLLIKDESEGLVLDTGLVEDESTRLELVSLRDDEDFKLVLIASLFDEDKKLEFASMM